MLFTPILPLPGTICPSVPAAGNARRIYWTKVCLCSWWSEKRLLSDGNNNNFFFSPNQIIYLSRWNGNSAVSSESFKTKLMKHTHKLRHSEASKSFFPSLRGVAFSLRRVRRTHACLKCHVSVAEPARLCSTGKYTVFFPLDLVMCVSSYHHPLFYFNRDQATLAT